MRKRLLTLLLVSAMTLSLCACGSSDSSNDDSKTETKVEETEKSNDSSDTLAEKDSDEDEEANDFTPIGDSLAIDFELYKPSKFPGDKTGRWYQTTFAKYGVEFQYYALNYYQEYFQADDEVHVVYNFSNKTVNSITCLSGLLFVSIHDYIDKEEHDASVACGGTLLAEYYIDPDTGIIEKLQ